MKKHGIFAALILAIGLTSQPAWAQSALKEIRDGGIMKVCFAQGTPESYKDPKTGEWNGVFVDLVKELASWMKVKTEYVEVQWDVAVLSLNRGDCQLFGGSLVYNAPRAMQINYIRPFGAKGINAVIPKDNPKGFKSSEDLNNPSVTLAVIVGSREHEIAKRLFPKAKMLALKTNADIQIIESVKRGDADAALLPTITIRWWQQVPENAGWGRLAFPGHDFGNSPNGWAIRYGDSDWKDFLDSFANWVVANDFAANLYTEYLKKTNPFAK